MRCLSTLNDNSRSLSAKRRVQHTELWNVAFLNSVGALTTQPITRTINVSRFNPSLAPFFENEQSLKNLWKYKNYHLTTLKYVLYLKQYKNMFSY